MTELYLLRHGETDYNKHFILIGGRSSHLSINETGRDQCRKLGDWFRAYDYDFDQVYCSTSNRAKQTLDGLKLEMDSALIHCSEQLEELSQGQWEGKKRSEIYTKEQESEIQADCYRFKAPGGESQWEVELRMYDAMEKMIRKHEGKKILVVSHGMAIKCLLRKILDFNPGMTRKVATDNCSITKLSYYKEKGWHVEYVNRVNR